MNFKAKIYIKDKSLPFYKRWDNSEQLQWISISFALIFLLILSNAENNIESTFESILKNIIYVCLGLFIISVIMRFGEYEKLNGKLEQVILGGQFKSISKEDPTVKLKRDITGKIVLDGDLRFIPNPNVSGNAQVQYRLSDGRAFSAIGVIPIVLAAHADQIIDMSMSFASSLEISNPAILKINARNEDLSEHLIFDLSFTQGDLTKSRTYEFTNNNAGIFEIDMKVLAQLLSEEIGFVYNQPIDISLRAQSDDGGVLSSWTTSPLS